MLPYWIWGWVDVVLALCSKVREEVAMKSHGLLDLVSKVQAATETHFYGLRRQSGHLTLTVSENTTARTEMLSKPLFQEGCTRPVLSPPPCPPHILSTKCKQTPSGREPGPQERNKAPVKRCSSSHSEVNLQFPFVSLSSWKNSSDLLL